ncbi:MAG: DUF6572 domain-containing protein [Caulobacteraceae bacterium]
MSVLETNLVDYIYLEEGAAQVPVLVVSDPLSWKPPEDRKHLWALREKLKTQIAFVETGQLNGVWPRYSGGVVRVEVYASCSLTETARDFYDHISRAMNESNMELRVRLLDA